MRVTKITSLITATVLIVAVHFSKGQNPLLIPPALNGTSFQLTVQPGVTQFFAGHNTPTLGVNGPLLGPTLFMQKDDSVTLNVSNNLVSTTTMHWHGLHVPAMFDGGPHQIIQPGTTWSPSFKIRNDAGTYWYHPHGEHQTDIQVSKGIAGMIIIKDSVEAALTLPRTYGTDDFPVIIQTKAFDMLYQVAVFTVHDTVPMVNGTINPFLDAPAQVVRLRLLNGASDRSFMLGFSNNMNFHLIATDGGLLDTTVTLNRIRLSNGERAEILVDLGSLQGDTVFLMNYGSQLPNGIMGSAQVGMGMAQIPDYNLNPLNGSDFQLLQLNVVAPTSGAVTTIPSALAPLNRFNPLLADTTRNFVLAPQTMGPSFMVEGPFTINGSQFNMNVTNQRIPFNNLEIWQLINNTLIAHPFHIHDVQFYVLNFNGSPAPPDQRGKKDVVLVMPQDTVTFITKFETFADTTPYMYHCHLLHHEDDGMMGSFAVLDSAILSGVNNVHATSPIKIYPNPASDIVHISTSGLAREESTITIADVTGKIILKQDLSMNKSTIDINLHSLSAGIYIVSIVSSGQNYYGRLIKSEN